MFISFRTPTFHNKYIYFKRYLPQILNLKHLLPVCIETVCIETFNHDWLHLCHLTTVIPCHHTAPLLPLCFYLLLPWESGGRRQEDEDGSSVTRKLGFKHFKHRSPGPAFLPNKTWAYITVLQIVRPATRGAARAQTIIRHARHVPYLREGAHMCGGHVLFLLNFPIYWAGMWRLPSVTIVVTVDCRYVDM